MNKGIKGDSLSGKTILLGVTGSVAAVKTVELARSLIRRGADVYVVEDSIKGFHSGTRARDLLLNVGIRINLHLIGVSQSLNKQQALKAAGAQQVFEDLNAALEMVF